MIGNWVGGLLVLLPYLLTAGMALTGGFHVPALLALAAGGTAFVTLG